jgi:hypothetical protein
MGVRKESLTMRIADVIIAGSVAVATALAAPALARHSDPQKSADDAAATSPCQGYEMGADGAWRQVPCQEAGPTAPAPRKSAAHSGIGQSQTH